MREFHFPYILSKRIPRKLHCPESLRRGLLTPLPQANNSSWLIYINHWIFTWNVKNDDWKTTFLWKGSFSGFMFKIWGICRGFYWITQYRLSWLRKQTSHGHSITFQKNWCSCHPSCFIDSYKKTIVSTNEKSHSMILQAWWQRRKQTCFPPLPNLEILMTLARKVNNGSKTFLTFHWILIGSLRDPDILVYETISISLDSIMHPPLQKTKQQYITSGPAGHYSIFFVGLLPKKNHKFALAGAQPPTNCSFARHLVGKMDILCSFAHH